MPFLRLLVVTFLGLILFMNQAHGLPLLNAADRTSTENCLAINAGNVLKEEVPTTIPADMLLYGCIETDKANTVNTTFIFNAGKINLVTLGVECQNVPLFSVSEEEDTQALPLVDMPSVCKNGMCVVYGAVNQRVLLSAALLEEELDAIRAQKIEVSFLVTDVLYDFEGLLEQFASSVLGAFLRQVTDSIELRKSVFLGSAMVTCSEIIHLDLRR